MPQKEEMVHTWTPPLLPAPPAPRCQGSGLLLPPTAAPGPRGPARSGPRSHTALLKPCQPPSQPQRLWAHVHDVGIQFKLNPEAAMLYTNPAASPCPGMPSAHNLSGHLLRSAPRALNAPDLAPQAWDLPEIRNLGRKPLIWDASHSQACSRRRGRQGLDD